MSTSQLRHNKNNVCFDELSHIKIFAELGAAESLFRDFWLGGYTGYIESASKNVDRKFTGVKSPKKGSTSWVNNREQENTAFLIAKIYGSLAPDNKLIQREPTKEEMVAVTVSYNIKYANNPADALLITHVHALLHGLRNIDSKKGIAIFRCSIACGAEFIARVTTAPATCPWCRSKIDKGGKKISPVGNFRLNINKLESLVPVTESLQPRFS